MQPSPFPTDARRTEYAARFNRVLDHIQTHLDEPLDLPDDRPCFEFTLNDPKTDPEGMHDVEICLAVKPL
jgi:DNA gyrase inhibitor GyrI